MFNREQPIFTCKAHVFHIDPKTKRSWLAASSSAVNVSFFYDSTRSLYRIISVEGTKVRRAGNDNVLHMKDNFFVKNHLSWRNKSLKRKMKKNQIIVQNHVSSVQEIMGRQVTFNTLPEKDQINLHNCLSRGNNSFILCIIYYV